MTCISCRYFLPESAGPDGITSGDCRRHAPAAVGYVEADESGAPAAHSASVWPVVAAGDWCGDWAAKGLEVVHSERGAGRA